MDVGALSGAISQASLKTDYGVAMLSKSLDASESEGQQIAKMIDASEMELSVNPAIGSNFDMMV